MFESRCLKPMCRKTAVTVRQTWPEKTVGAWEAPKRSRVSRSSEPPFPSRTSHTARQATARPMAQ